MPQQPKHARMAIIGRRSVREAVYRAQIPNGEEDSEGSCVQSPYPYPAKSVKPSGRTGRREAVDAH
eukprot:3812534-Prorocentrum_lima.AAC.1